MRRTVTALLVMASIALGATALAQEPPVRTPAEQSDFRRYTQARDVWAFLQTVSAASRRVQVKVAGKTGEGKDFPATDIYLVILSENGAETPQELDRKKPTILITASQHGNEHSGKEAALDAHSRPRGGRPQAAAQAGERPRHAADEPVRQLRGQAAERAGARPQPRSRQARSALRPAPSTASSAAWMPEVTLDVHEKGYDYYRVNTGCVTNPNIGAAIRRFSIDTVFKETEAFVKANGSTWHEYLVTEAMGSQGAAGAPEPADASRRETLFRPSTTDLNDGRNSLGIYETISFIQEGASRHDIPTLKDRTDYQYLGIKALVQTTAKNASQVLQLVRSSRAALLKKAQAPAANDLVHLRMVHARDPKEPEITIQSFERPAGPPPRPRTRRS